MALLRAVRATAVAPSHGPGIGAGAVTPEASLLPAAAPSEAGVTVLRVTDIEPYEHNQGTPPTRCSRPSRRRFCSAAWLPAQGHAATGAAHYVVAAGGNTRLLATQLQLAGSWPTRASRRCRWSSRRDGVRSDVLAGHLIENEQRSDLTFWDKAQGVVALKAALEQERAAALSLRQWESALTDLGLPIGKNVLSSYLFA
ncbi:MAG: hypothetical protein IPO82_10255, partial [Betaproteobacteria bacterium]|nr:hypothetical protein [Betaproteobacteria bacterium]